MEKSPVVLAKILSKGHQKGDEKQNSDKLVAASSLKKTKPKLFSSLKDKSITVVNVNCAHPAVHEQSISGVVICQLKHI